MWRRRREAATARRSQPRPFDSSDACGESMSKEPGCRRLCDRSRSSSLCTMFGTLPLSLALSLSLSRRRPLTHARAFVGVCMCVFVRRCRTTSSKTCAGPSPRAAASPSRRPFRCRPCPSCSSAFRCAPPASPLRLARAHAARAADARRGAHGLGQDGGLRRAAAGAAGQARLGGRARACARAYQRHAPLATRARVRACVCALTLSATRRAGGPAVQAVHAHQSRPQVQDLRARQGERPRARVAARDARQRRAERADASHRRTRAAMDSPRRSATW